MHHKTDSEDGNYLSSKENVEESLDHASDHEHHGSSENIHKHIEDKIEIDDRLSGNHDFDYDVETYNKINKEYENMSNKSPRASVQPNSGIISNKNKPDKNKEVTFKAHSPKQQPKEQPKKEETKSPLNLNEHEIEQNSFDKLNKGDHSDRLPSNGSESHEVEVDEINQEMPVGVEPSHNEAQHFETDEQSESDKEQPHENEENEINEQEESEHTCNMFDKDNEDEGKDTYYQKQQDECSEHEESVKKSQLEEQKSNQSFGRQDADHHIEVSNQDQDILDFKKAMDLKYQNFRRNILEKYQQIRLEYLKQMDIRIRESERENHSSIDFMEQSLEEANNEKDASIKRATQSRIILANVMREKYNTFYLKRACFQSLKHYYEWRKYEDAKSKFCDNYYRKR